MAEQIMLQNRSKLSIEKKVAGNSIEVSLHLKEKEDCELHWGFSKKQRSVWQRPPGNEWPEGSRAYDRTAVRTPFLYVNGDSMVNIQFDKNSDYANLVFALFYPDKGRWDNNRGKNYAINLPVIKKESSLSSQLKNATEGKNVIRKERYSLGEEGELTAVVCNDGDGYEIILVSDISQPLIFHWGAALKSRHEWQLPSEELYPAGTTVFDDKAVQTPFIFREGSNQLTLTFSEADAPRGIPFVLYIKEENRWLKNRNSNFFIPIAQSGEEDYPELSELAGEIIHGETGDHGWTLMHRFNLCHDLIEDTRNSIEGLAMIYVWMRYSTIRQLDWQRRYNTKPKELSHAQDRLTLKISDIYKNVPESRELLRLIIATLGRGGEGQRIRDEILHIMHRHHIKEVSGHFMEEWHQKLHNNTTPDDVVICEAYLEFLRSNGDLDLFYRTLNNGGVSRERMESFERPITSSPDFISHLKDALIHDFGNYLKLLKSIHSGTDLESAINSARHLLDGETGSLIDSIWHDRGTGIAGITDYIANITRVRLVLNERLGNEENIYRIRDMLFLDLALEDFIRTVIERNIHEKPDENQLVELTGLVLENIRFSYDCNELSVIHQQWHHILGLSRFSKDWALHAKATLERMSRAASAFVDRYYHLFQPKAEHLGREFAADSWVVTLFSEEVVRGMPVFVLSMLIRNLGPIMRQYAKIGDWHIVSPGRTKGWVEVAESLGDVQGRKYDRPSVIVADRVRGNEEPPEGVTAIITPDTVDLVSHVAVRARNAHLLFATCYDDSRIDQLKSHRGQMLDLNVTVSGDVEFSEAEPGEASVSSRINFQYERKSLPEFSAYALSARDFNSSLVGGKSHNLKSLENNLPEWIHLPSSAALPFGIFDKVIGLDRNREFAEAYNKLFVRIDNNPENVLPELQHTIINLHAPDDLEADLRKVMNASGMGLSEKWDDIWLCIKQVWASKWNERAYFSRNAWKIKHEDIFMAVLIQQVVEAEYAFVIHTVNPSTGAAHELYAEAVPGLGETLVGNYPGTSFSFMADKNTHTSEILSYPGKSAGLFGSGLIFRSDSNAEDLPGYAGAGLYDSIMLETPREETMNYTRDILTWNDNFKKELMGNILKIGIHIEKAFSFPQDIEGVYSKGKYYIVQTRPQVGLIK
jgi:alpha-glucan,water dikinase